MTFGLIILMTPAFSIKVKLWATAILIADLTISSLILDYSADGITYHDDAIEFIASQRYLWWGKTTDDLRIASYPIGGWLLPALYRNVLDYSLVNTGGKLIAIAITISIFRETNKLIRPRFYRVVTPLLLSTPPILLSQFFTGYLDWWTYYLSTWFCLYLFQLEHSKSAAPALFCICILATIIKIQACIIILILTTLFFLHISIVDRRRLIEIFSNLNFKTILLGCILVLTAILSVYGKNFFIYGSVSPFSAAKGSFNILYDNEFYKNTPPLSHIFRSIFTGAAVNSDNPPIKLVGWNLSNFGTFAQPDMRFGAHGPFAGILLLLTWLVLAIRIRNGNNSFLLLFSIFLIFLPGIGTARYYPIIYLVFVLTFIENFHIRAARVTFLSFLLLNQIFIVAGVIKGKIEHEQRYVRFTEANLVNKTVVGDFSGFDYHKRRLESDRFQVKMPAEGQICPSLHVKHPNLFHDEIEYCGN